MDTVILIGVVLVAVLVMLSGVWVAAVLIRTVTHAPQRTTSSPQGRLVDETRP
jgi:hypothetical protein